MSFKERMVSSFMTVLGLTSTILNTYVYAEDSIQYSTD